MENNKITTLLLGAILAVSLGVLIVSLNLEVKPEITVNPADVNIGNLGGIENDWYDTATHTRIDISAATSGVTQALAANSGRKYARIQNIGSTAVTCWLNSTTTGLIAGTGIVLYGTSTTADLSVYEITPQNLYKGLVRCVSQSGTSTISIIDK